MYTYKTMVYDTEEHMAWSSSSDNSMYTYRTMVDNNYSIAPLILNAEQTLYESRITKYFIMRLKWHTGSEFTHVQDLMTSRPIEITHLAIFCSHLDVILSSLE